MKFLTGIKYGNTKKIIQLQYSNWIIAENQITEANKRGIRVLILVK